MSLTLHQFAEPSHLLQSAIQAFEEWRTTRKIRGPIPEQLWLTVQPLLTHYTASQIAKTLHLNSTQLKTRFNLPSRLPLEDPFVECAQPFSHGRLQKQQDEPTHYTLEFDCKHASMVKIRGLSADVLKQLVFVLTGEMPCCN